MKKTTQMTDSDIKVAMYEEIKILKDLLYRALCDSRLGIKMDKKLNQDIKKALKPKGIKE